jgi:hypothetical protein
MRLQIFLASWFESLAVASHPLQPDSFIFGKSVAARHRNQHARRMRYPNSWSFV